MATTNENTQTDQDFDEDQSKSTGRIDKMQDFYESRPKFWDEFDDEESGMGSWAQQMRSAGIYQPLDMLYNTKFYRLRRIDPYYRVEGAIEYLFFTKPDLNIVGPNGKLTTGDIHMNNIEGDSGSFAHNFQQMILGAGTGSFKAGTAAVPYFNMLKELGYEQTFADLCSSYIRSGNEGDKCPFIRILSNRKTSNLDIPDISVEDLETSQNLYGFKLHYPLSSLKSDEDMEFSIDFEDTQYLEVYHLFKAWDLFRRLKWLGVVFPKKEYIENKILCDHISVFKFLVDVDGETLLYWAKATGVYPKTISRSSFSEMGKDGALNINVTFKVSGWFEDMDPNILEDFNHLVNEWKGTITPASIWNDAVEAVDGSNLDGFYVIKRGTQGFSLAGGHVNQRYYLVGFGEHGVNQSSTRKDTDFVSPFEHN